MLPIQVGRVDAEVRLRRVLHAERVIAERDQVQVSGQDFRFCEGLVQRECHPDLAKLAGRSGFDGRSLLGIGLGCHQQLVVLHVLLFERRAAARVEVAGRVARQAGQGALPVHAAVVGEPLIFNRDDRQLHRVGDLVRGHLEPALRVQPRDRVALRVDHRRYRRHLPSSSWAEPLATTSEARLDISPSPPANGNVSAVATTLANRQHPASFRTVIAAGRRSGMRTTVATSCHSTVPLGPIESFRGRVSHCGIGAGAIFAAASLVRPRKRDRSGGISPADPDKTARSSQKALSYCCAIGTRPPNLYRSVRYR